MTNNTYYESILDFIEAVTERNQRYCVNIASAILSRTGHVPVAYNVARGAAYCSYFARMVECIGVKEFIPLRIPGKGKDIHRILGIASFYLFQDGILPPKYHLIDESIKKALSELKEFGLITSEQEDETIRKAKLMLENLVNNIPHMLRILDANNEPFDPIIEQQFIDYEVHLRGVPDLILENKEQRKAIVVEWKSSTDRPWGWEEAQVLAYSLLAARRLGFERKQAREAILGKLDESTDTFFDLHILPVIIRPNTTERAIIKPHPALSGYNGPDLRKQYEKFRELLANVLLEAEHLTILNFSVERFSPSESKEALKRCEAYTRDGHKVYSLRYTPHQLPRGKPAHQDTYPCTACTPTIKDACKFYYGRGFGNIDEFDKTMWSLRFKVYEKLESLLIPYRAIYEIFKQKGKDVVLDWIKKGYKIIWEEGGGYSTLSYETPPIIEIVTMRKRRQSRQKIRVDCLDNFETEDPINKTLTLLRPVRQFEEDGRYSVIHEDKTVILLLLDTNNPLLSPSLFCRVEEVQADADNVKYVLGLPSVVFDYQFMLFRHYLSRNKERRYDILLVEMGVNLLHLELKSIDLLQRATDEFMDNEEERRNIKRFLTEIRQEYEKNYYGEVPLFLENLRQIIKHGHPKVRNKVR